MMRQCDRPEQLNTARLNCRLRRNDGFEVAGAYGLKVKLKFVGGEFMKVARYGCATVLALALVGSLWHPLAQAQSVKNPPLMGADPTWPKPLPNGWVTGQVGGTCIDSQDNIFIVTRGFQTGGLTSPEGVGGANPSNGALGGT